MIMSNYSMAKTLASAEESAGYGSTRSGNTPYRSARIRARPEGRTPYVGAVVPDLPVIAFTGGGTAGHVFPGIAVAEALGRRVLWIGSRNGVEKKLAEDAGIEFRGIPAGKLRRYFSLRNLSDIGRIISAVFAAVRIVSKEKPAFLFSKGGFVSVPPVVAARLCGIPAYTHESDFDPGLATRINLIFCEKVLVSFAETVDFLPARFRRKAVVTGNPVRRAMYKADAGRGRRFLGCDASTQVILVLGGSQGSSFINGLIASCVERLVPRFFVVHQMGAQDYCASTLRNYLPAAFFSAELPDIIAAADLVICRSGANTLAELAALGRPSVLIPLSRSGSRGDQLRNAEVFRARGASLVLQEQEATGDTLLAVVCPLLADTRKLQEMGRNARSLSAGRPAETIAKLITERLS
jgi:UDP-N-acetylglucosamine--N-acetylmuramyl-(pentapeptide) pyrophosphoryl-undecaprenol N-acetylglucosamine transferase